MLIGLCTELPELDFPTLKTDAFLYSAFVRVPDSLLKVFFFSILAERGFFLIITLIRFGLQPLTLGFKHRGSRTNSVAVDTCPARSIGYSAADFCVQGETLHTPPCATWPCPECAGGLTLQYE